MVGVCNEVVGLAGVVVATVVGAEVGFASALVVGFEDYFVGFAVELLVPVVVENFGIGDKLEG